LTHTVQANALGIGKVGLRYSATHGTKTPEPITMKLGVRNYVRDLTSKYGMGVIGLRGEPRRMRKISLFDFLCFFSFQTMNTMH